MSKEQFVTKKDLEELGKAWTTKFETTIEELKKIGERSSSSTEASSPSEVKSEVPKYKCTGKKCGFYTDDGIEMILHEMREHSKPAHAEEPEETAPPAPKRERHGRSAAEIWDCPECSANLERELDLRGKKIVDKEPQKKEPEKPQKKGLGEL